MKCRYGLIGEKLGHSYSKIIHEKFGYYDYELVPIENKNLDEFLKRKDFDGLNVTIPYKQSVIPYCSKLSEKAKKIGSVNTIIKLPDGSLYGDNTDYDGFLYMANSKGISFEGKKVIILGSGGTSKTACTAVKDNGGEPIVVSRKGENNYNNLHLHKDAKVIVNTTPVGMFPNTENSPVDLAAFPDCEGVIDVIYNPYRTRLLQQADTLNIKNIGGLSMLVAQAKYAGELFTGKEIPTQQIEKIKNELESEMLNIAFIGMPGSGKTAVAKKIARELNRPFVDLDKAIEKQAGMSIPEIFKLKGEDEFRNIEAKVTAEYSKKSGMVISTGGGVILREENRKNLRQNSVVIELTRDLNKLDKGGRPLSKSLDALKEIKRQRKPLYEECSDFTVDNNGHFDDTVSLVKESIYAFFGN